MLWKTLRIKGHIKEPLLFKDTTMKKIAIIAAVLLAAHARVSAAFLLHNDYAYLQEITFELYNDNVEPYKVPDQLKSIEETLMFEVLHATWKDKHWVAYTLNKDLLGTYKVGQPALLDDGDVKKIYFVAAFPGSIGGLDLYTSEYANGKWSKPKNLGKGINTSGNESNPGLLNEHTLTYSSAGIIKKLDLNTLKVVDLEETAVVEKKVTEVTPVKEKEVVAPVVEAAAPVATTPAKTEVPKQVVAEVPVVPEKPVKQETPASSKLQQNSAVNLTPAPVVISPVSTTPASVQSMGTQTRDAMLAKYKTAIQLGAFTTPKWEQLQPLSKFGQLMTYKNEKGANVVWLVGYASRAAAEAVLPQVKAMPGFEGAYVTGK